MTPDLSDEDKREMGRDLESQARRRHDDRAGIEWGADLDQYGQFVTSHPSEQQIVIHTLDGPDEWLACTVAAEVRR